MLNIKKVIIVMILVGLIVLGLFGYIIYDKVQKENETIKTENKTEEENSLNDTKNMNVSIKDNIVYVNGNKVDMYNYFVKKDENHSKWWKSEDDFYMHKDGGVDAYFKYEIIDDIVFIDYEPANCLGAQMLFVDKNGVINYDIDNKIAFSGIKRGYYIEDKSIVIENRTMDANIEGLACNKVSLGLGDEVGITYYKIEYLGDNKFSIDKKYKELTYDEIVDDKDTFHYYCEN